MNDKGNRSSTGKGGTGSSRRTRMPSKKTARKIKYLLKNFLTSRTEEKKMKSPFEIKLDEMVGMNGSAIMGRVHLINLRDLIIKRKDAEEALERAEKIAESVINETLKEGDLFTRGSDGAFYFLFADSNETAGELKCSVIANQIARLLSGKYSTLFRLEIEHLVETVDHASVETARKKVVKNRGSTHATNIQKRLREARERKRMEQAIASVTPKAIGETETTAPAPSDNDTLPALKPPLPPLEGISVKYGTIWNIKTNLLTAYSCILMVREANGNTVRFKLKHRAEQQRRTLLAIDQFTQRKAIPGLRELLKSGKKTLVVLPVHYTSVDQDAPSLIYRQGLEGLNEDERRHVVLELVDLPLDLSGIWAGKVVRNMRNIARTVMVRVPIKAKNIESWRDAGIHAVGFDLSTQHTDEGLLLPQMEQFVENSEKNGLRSFIYGVDRITTAIMAVSAGFDYIEGAAICAPADSIEHIRPFKAENLLAHLKP